MLAKRTLSSVIIVLIATILILFGGWIYAAGIAVILSIAVWEFVAMFKHGGFYTKPTLTAVIALVAIILRNLADQVFFSMGLVLAIFAICISFIYTYKEHREKTAVPLAVGLAAFAFIVIPGAFLIDLRNMQYGIAWVIVSILPASLGDVGAYLIGSLIGKHRLAPSLSPNKTLEGYFGGICFAGIAGVILGFTYSSLGIDQSPVIITLICVVIGIFAPLGDLTKSIIKRNFSLKDTGNLIPGHGGMLDRIDTILWAAPMTFFLVYFLVR